jgi:hypothetical protein
VRAPVLGSDFTLSGVCAFDVDVTILQNKEVSTTFADGSFLVTGALKFRLTNLSDPSNSMDVNVSGPGRFTPTADGGLVVDAWGKWFFWFFPGDLGPGSPGMMILTNGHAIETFTGSGTQTFTHVGSTTDVCAALA